MRFHGDLMLILQDCVGFCRMLLDFMGFYGDSTGFHGDFVEFHGEFIYIVVFFCGVFNRISWDFIGFHDD